MQHLRRAVDGDLRALREGRVRESPVRAVFALQRLLRVRCDARGNGRTGGGKIRFAVVALAAMAMRAQPADELIAKNLAARGGLERLEKARSERLRARITMDGVEGTLQLERQRAGTAREFRTEITMEGRSYARGFDGVLAWSQMGTAGEGWQAAERLRGDDVDTLREDAEFDDGLLDVPERGATVRYDGRTAVDGKDVYKLMLRLRDGNVFYCYLDGGTWLETRRSGARVIGGREAMIDWTFGDYRLSGGMQVPYRIESASRDTGERQTIQVEQIEWNVALAGERFQPARTGSGVDRASR